MPNIIQGEYIQVAKWSRNVEGLRKAHRKNISQNRTREITSSLDEIFGFSTKIHFWDGYPETTDEEQPEIHLPKGYSWDLYRRLRLGAVLHEYAHVIKIRWERSPTRDHSKVFVEILDELVEWTKSRNSNKLLERVKLILQ